MIIPSLPFHTVLASSHQCFRQCRNNLFAGASDSELHRRLAPSIAPRQAYRQISPPNNHGNIGGCDWLSPARVGFVVHDFVLPHARTYPETSRTSNTSTISNRSRLAPPNADAGP